MAGWKIPEQKMEVLGKSLTFMANFPAIHVFIYQRVTIIYQSYNQNFTIYIYIHLYNHFFEYYYQCFDYNQKIIIYYQSMNSITIINSFDYFSYNCVHIHICIIHIYIYMYSIIVYHYCDYHNHYYK